MVQEDTSFSSRLWTVEELLDYLNEATYHFILKTQFWKVTGNVSGSNGTRLYTDPSDSMQIDRITFRNRPIYRTNKQQLDHEDPAWRTRSGKPKRYHQDQLATHRFETDYAPATADLNGGNEFELVYTKLPTELTDIGDTVAMPNYTHMYLKFGVLARMLSKEGEAQDPARAQYSEARFMNGVNLIRKLMGLPAVEE